MKKIVLSILSIFFCLGMLTGGAIMLSGCNSSSYSENNPLEENPGGGNGDNENLDDDSQNENGGENDENLSDDDHNAEGQAEYFTIGLQGYFYGFSSGGTGNIQVLLSPSNDSTQTWSRRLGVNRTYESLQFPESYLGTFLIEANSQYYGNDYGIGINTSNINYIGDGYDSTNYNFSQSSLNKTTTIGFYVYNKHTLSYRSNGGAGSMTSTTDYHSADVTVKSNSFTRTNYEFLYWTTTSSGGTKYYPGDEITLNSDITLYAQWEQTTVYYTYTYYSNPPVSGVAERSVSYQYEEGTTVSSISCPWSFSSYYYYFNGWSGFNSRVTQNRTINATWYYSPPISYYDVTYSGNGATGGSTSGHYDVEEDTYITIRSCGFTKTGYTFVEWNTNSSGTGTGYDPGDRYRVDYDEVLYAIWKINTYTVSFNGNGATSGSMSSQTKTYGVTLTLRANTFVRTGYNFLGWSTSSSATTATWGDKGSYTNNASNTLYAVWEAKIIPVSLNWNSGNGGTSMIYLKYDSGWYSNSTATSSITSITAPTRTGFAFNGYNTNSSGTGATLINSSGTITASDTFYSTDGTKTIYAQWSANNPAYYDEEGGYWYIENGNMPQKKVTDSGTISGINSSSTTGTTYYFAGLSMQSKVYGGKEYCQYNSNWYEVMPIKWRLVYSSSQTTGYGTETDTLAVMAEIVYADAFSDSHLGANAGYSSESVTELKKNQIAGTYLVTETKSMLTFGSTTINGTPTSVTENIFVASSEDISNFTTNANGMEKEGSIKFSDLAKDYLLANGKGTLYYTRDLGTNYNNIWCMNANGDRVQYKVSNYLGVQFSIKVTEYACV